MEIKFQAKLTLNKKFGHFTTYDFSVITEGDKDETSLTYDDVLFEMYNEGERLGYTEEAYPQIDTYCIYIKKPLDNGNDKLYPVIDEDDEDMKAKQKELADEVCADRTLVLPGARYFVNKSYELFLKMKDAGIIKPDAKFDNDMIGELYEKFKDILTDDGGEEFGDA